MPSRAPRRRSPGSAAPKRKSAARQRKRLYDRRAWRNYRDGYLAEKPLCVNHLSREETVESTVVDHIVPHRGDMRLFWDPNNHQALCSACHGEKSQAERET